MIYKFLFPKLFSIVFFVYGVFLITLNFGVEVDDYYSYKDIFIGDKELVFQPIFNLLLSIASPLDYDIFRAILALVICILLSLTIYGCKSRLWFILALTFAWYLESLIIVHIRMGLAFALFVFIYPRYRNPLWFIFLILIHYVVLLYLIMYFLISTGRIKIALSFVLMFFLFVFFTYSELLNELDQYRVYISVIPYENLIYFIFFAFVVASFFVMKEGVGWRLFNLIILAILSKLFLEQELGGRISSIIILFIVFFSTYPIIYKNRYAKKIIR